MVQDSYLDHYCILRAFQVIFSFTVYAHFPARSSLRPMVLRPVMTLKNHDVYPRKPLYFVSTILKER